MDNRQSQKQFVGREYELGQIKQIQASKEPALIVVHGRRRIGKTTLIEHAFKQQPLIKLEGLENVDDQGQMASTLEQLGAQTGNTALSHIKPTAWRETLRVITDTIAKQYRVLFLEEFQWLAANRHDLVAEIKFFWDNYWSKIPGFILVLCGSSASFMVGQVIRSKALYNRSLHEIPLGPFDLAETQAFLNHCPPQHALDAHLLVGGVPAYLAYLKNEPSLYLSLCRNAFIPGGFFVGEYERIFVSNLASNPHYRRIIHFLSNRRFATRKEITQFLGIASGGNLSEVLEDLQACSFIHKYVPVDKKMNSLVSRYELSDPYLQFYSKFVEPKLQEISNRRYLENPLSALPIDRLEQWLGYSLERLCRQQSHVIAKALGFSGVEYTSGAYFERGSESASNGSGFQIDLVFHRKDRVMTLCEIKHNTQAITLSQAKKTISSFGLMPVPKRYVTQRVLIATGGVTDEVKNGPYFDIILNPLDVFFN